MYTSLNSLRSQKEAGESFAFTYAVYTVIPKNGSLPRYMQPKSDKNAIRNLAEALHTAKAEGDTVIAAWIGKYKTDMFLIDDIDAVISELEAKIFK